MSDLPDQDAAPTGFDALADRESAGSNASHNQATVTAAAAAMLPPSSMSIWVSTDNLNFGFAGMRSTGTFTTAGPGTPNPTNFATVVSAMTPTNPSAFNHRPTQTHTSSKEHQPAVTAHWPPDNPAEATAAGGGETLDRQPNNVGAIPATPSNSALIGVLAGALAFSIIGMVVLCYLWRRERARVSRRPDRSSESTKVGTPKMDKSWRSRWKSGYPPTSVEWGISTTGKDEDERSPPGDRSLAEAKGPHARPMVSALKRPHQPASEPAFKECVRVEAATPESIRSARKSSGESGKYFPYPSLSQPR